MAVTVHLLWFPTAALLGVRRPRIIVRQFLSGLPPPGHQNGCLHDASARTSPIRPTSSPKKISTVGIVGWNDRRTWRTFDRAVFHCRSGEGWPQTGPQHLSTRRRQSTGDMGSKTQHGYRRAVSINPHFRPGNAHLRAATKHGKKLPYKGKACNFSPATYEKLEAINSGTE